MKPSIVDQDLFDRLAQKNGQALVSIFMPTHTKGRDVSQDGIRLKNALAEADGELERHGVKPRQREDRLRVAHSLLEDREFWEHQRLGLALFIDEDGSVTSLSLGSPVAEAVFVMTVFLMRPLLGELSGEEMPVLALTRGEVALFAVTTSAARRVAADLPESFADVNWFVDRESQRQQHPDRAGTDRARHGHDPSTQEDEDVVRFLRAVDGALAEGDTLVVLGNDDLAARFKDVTDREVISPENSGLQSPFTESEVQAAVGPILHETARDRERRAVAAAKEQLGAGNATTDISEAMQAAVSGRIAQVVIVPDMGPIWGRIDATTMEVTTHEERGLADVDLADRMVVLSMRNGADVTPIQEGLSDYRFIATMRF